MRLFSCVSAMLFVAAIVVSPVQAADPIELPMTVAVSGKLLVDIKINDQPLTCIVDTGSPFFLLIDQQIADKQNLEKHLFRTRLRFFAEELGGSTYHVVFPRVRIGSLHYEDVEGLTIDDIRRATGIGYMNLPNFWAQGILGMGFLEHFRVKIDYLRSTLTLYPADLNSKINLASHIAPIVPVGPSGKAVPFLLDTGSTFSIVSEKVMEPLGLRYLSVGGTGRDRLYQGTAQAEAINIGSVEIKNATFEIAGHFEEYAGRSVISGIIGYDFLKDFVVDLDFPHGTLDIAKP